jgi:glycosyltransferase involved in cell wall biosynthesis
VSKPLGRGVVFATYNGLLDPLGPSQILPYLERLHRDFPVHILSFERSDRLAQRPALEAMDRRTAAAGIGWTWLRYHKTPSLPAKVFDLAVGTFTLRRILGHGSVGLVHARGYLPMALAVRATRRIPILFDIRGLQPEEYVDGGLWKEGELKWRLTKASERTFFRRASGAVVLTRNILPFVEQRFALHGRAPPVSVIPCCVDLGRFTFDERARSERRVALGVADSAVLFVYSGSIGTWYMPEAMARFVRAFKRSTGRAVFLLWMVNNEQERVQAASRAAGLEASEFTALHAAPRDVPAYLSAADVALAMIRPTFSKRASSPTKYAECLAMGLPLVICKDVGDGNELEPLGGAVTVVSDCHDNDLADASARLAALMTRGRPHFRRVAAELFDVDRVGVPAYRSLYEKLMA